MKNPLRRLFDSLSSVERILFTKHLAIMLKSGIPLLDAVGSIKDQADHAPFKRILSSLENDVKNGQPLYKSLQKFPDDFSPLYLGLIEIGEESGNLEKNLDYLSGQLEKEFEFGKKLKGALMYPLLVLLVAFGALIGISLFILPQFTNLFDSMDITLPFTTKILISLSNLMKNYGFYIFGFLFLLVIFFIFLINTAKIKPYWQKFLLFFPVIGKIIKNSQTAVFCRNLGLMLKSGLPISKALETLARQSEHVVFRDIALRLSRAMDEGRSLEEEISLNSRQELPKIVGKMIGVGERTGKLDESLIYLGEFFENEVDGQTRNLPALLEPMLLVVIAGMVLFLALAIVSPIYQFTGSIK